VIKTKHKQEFVALILCSSLFCIGNVIVLWLELKLTVLDGSWCNSRNSLFQL